MPIWYNADVKLETIQITGGAEVALAFKDGCLVSRSAQFGIRVWQRPADLAQTRLGCEPSVSSVFLRDGADVVDFAFRVVPFVAAPFPVPQFGDAVTPAAQRACALFLGQDGVGDDFWVARGEWNDFLVFGRRCGADWRIGACTVKATTLTVRFEDFWRRIPTSCSTFCYDLSAVRDPQTKDAPETVVGGLVRETVCELAPDVRVCVDLADNGGFLFEFVNRNGRA